MSSTTITHKRRAKTPSFSSILLDSIYRSIDDTDSSTTTTTATANMGNDCNNNICNYDHYIEASKHRRTKMRSDSSLETIELRHAIMIESWMEKQPLQPQPQPQTQTQKPHYYDSEFIHNNNVDQHNIQIIRQKSVPNRSRTASTDNNSGICSSNEFASAISSSCFMPSKIRTHLSPRSADSCLRGPKAASAREREISSSSRIFTKTKSRALKIYSELKKSRQQQQQQPISPGARIAAFLNSIFRNTGSTSAPVKRSPEYPLASSSATTPATVPTSTCSSASSLSRSCLSKTTTSTDKSKRSVRFYPVSVIVDEEARQCGQKSVCKNKNKFLHNDSDSVVDDQSLLLSDQQQHQRKWKREKEIDALMMMVRKNCSDDHHQREVLCFESDEDEHDEMNVDDEEEEDGESCASSDLFELENLSSIGVTRFSQELPVYGTTSLKNLTV